MDLYDDALVLRMPPNLVKIEMTTRPPPTFPEDEIAERVDFSQIDTITPRPIKRLFSTIVEIELQTKSREAWTIRAGSRVGEIIMIAYQRWRNHAGL